MRVRYFFVVSNNLGNNEVQKFLRKFGIETRLFRHNPQTSYLGFFSSWITRRQVMLCFKNPNALGGSKTLRKNMNQRGIEVINRAPHREEFFVNPSGNFVSHGGGTRIKFLLGHYRSLRVTSITRLRFHEDHQGLHEQVSKHGLWWTVLKLVCPGKAP